MNVESASCAETGTVDPGGDERGGRLEDPMQQDFREVAPVLAVLAASTLAGMLQWTNGHYKPNAVLIVTAVWVLALVALCGRLTLRSGSGTKSAMVGLFGCALATQLGLMVTEPPTTDMVVPDAGLMHLFHMMVVLVALLTGIGLAGREPLRVTAASGPGTSAVMDRLWFPALVLLHFAMGRLVIGFVAEPPIDVWSIEMDSLRALVHGTNPYTITFVDPYGGTSGFFPPGSSVNGRLMFGFVYPPLCLLLCLPGYLLGGDSRWSLLVAMEVAAVLVAYARPGRLSKLAAAGLLFMPRTFFVMDHAWTDSFIVLLTAAVAFTAIRKPRWAFVFIGMYVCLKQHMFLGIPALFMLIPRPIPWSRVGILTLKGAAVAAVVTVPFILWGPLAFWRSALEIILKDVFRSDSLGLVAYFYNTGTCRLSKWTGLLVMLPVIVVGLWRGPRTPGGFALFAGVTHMTLYLFGTHGFCNEYYNVVGALYCAAAVWGPYDGAELVGAGVSSRRSALAVAAPLAIRSPDGA